MKKIVIIHHEPLTKKIKRNFFIDELLGKGILVEYWSIHKLLFNSLKLIDEVMEDYSCEIDSYQCLKDKIKKQKDSLFLLEFDLTLKTFWIRYYLTKYNCLTSVLGIHSSINLSCKEKIMNIRNYGINKILPFLKSLNDRAGVCILNLLFPIKRHDIVFYCGKASYRQFVEIPKVSVNSFDFEDYRDLKNQNCPLDLIGRKYAVFLDEYLPYHPDISIWAKQKITPQKYYSDLNRFFTWIESKYSLEVLIAAHPKSNYSNDIFGGRSIYKYRTAELIKYSQMAFVHDSLSISFPVLEYKPIIFIYTSEFYKIGSTIMVLMKKNSKMLGAPLLRIDVENYLIDNLNTLDKEKYDIYKYNYLTSKASENSSNSEIIYSVVSKL